MSKHPVAKRPPMSLGGSSLSHPYYTEWTYGPQPPLGINMSALQHVQTPSGKASPHEFGGVISQPPLLYCMGIRPPATPGDQSVCVTTCMGHVPMSLGGSFSIPLLYYMSIRTPATPGDQNVFLTTCFGKLPFCPWCWKITFLPLVSCVATCFPQLAPGANF